VGKSALVAQLREQLAFLISVNSGHLGSICAGLEPQVGLESAGLRLLQRKQRLREAVAAAGRTDVGCAFDEALSLAGRRLPLAVFRHSTGRALVRKTSWEVEKNLSRLAAAWQEKIGASISELVRQTESHAAAELAGLEQMVGQTRSSEPRLRQLLAKITAMHEELQAAPVDSTPQQREAICPLPAPG
jgi:hypothetical protein